VESLRKQYFGIFKININIWLLRILLFFLTVLLLISSFGSVIVAVQLNELLLGNFSSFSIEKFIMFILIGGIAFICFIYPLNFILLRNSKPYERFIKPIYLILLFTAHILLVYATIYLSIALFFVIVYGVLMPPEIYCLFNNNAIHLKEFELLHKQAFVLAIFVVLIIFLTYSLYSLYCAYRIKNNFFDYEIFDKINLFWETHQREKTIRVIGYRNLNYNTFNYKMAETLYKSFIYYFSAIWVLEPVAIILFLFRDTISREFLTFKLTMDDSFIFNSLMVNIIFFFVPLHIFFKIKNIYGFRMTSYLNENLIDRGINFYCNYLNWFFSIFITLNIYGVYYVLEKYGGIVTNTTIKSVIAFTVLVVTTYGFPKPRQILNSLMKPIKYEL
jgi:hypothetical protein